MKIYFYFFQLDRVQLGANEKFYQRIWFNRITQTMSHLKHASSKPSILILLPSQNNKPVKYYSASIQNTPKKARACNRRSQNPSTYPPDKNSTIPDDQPQRPIAPVSVFQFESRIHSPQTHCVCIWRVRRPWRASIDNGPRPINISQNDQPLLTDAQTYH